MYESKSPNESDNIKRTKDEPSHDKVFDTHPHDNNEPTNNMRRTFGLSWRATYD